MSRISGFDKVIFADAYQLLDDAVSGEERIAKSKKFRLQSYSLSAILDYIGLPNKIDNDYEAMNARLQGRDVDISDIAAYCHFDTISLLIADRAKDCTESYL